MEAHSSPPLFGCLRKRIRDDLVFIVGIMVYNFSERELIIYIITTEYSKDFGVFIIDYVI